MSTIQNQQAIYKNLVHDIIARILAGSKSEAECRLLSAIKDPNTPSPLRDVLIRAVNWLTTLQDEHHCIAELRKVM